MIGLYYTGAKKYFGKQNLPGKSLGGNISSSKIPNKKMGNLFRSISETTVSKGLEEMRCIAIKNEGQLSISEITLGIELEADTISAFNAFLIMPAQGSSLGYYFEELDDSESIPTIGTLVPLTNLESISVTGLTWKVGDYLGIWLQRVIARPSSLSSLDCPECDVLQAQMEAGQEIKREELYKLKIDFVEIPAV